MHTIVPIIMLFGASVFITGLFIYAKYGLQQVKQIQFFGKDYKLWQFTLFTISSGIILIMLSIFIHKSIPYVPGLDNQQTVPVQAIKSDFEQELELSDISSDAMLTYVRNFQQEYQQALNENDENTIGLLRMELQFRLLTELEKQGLDGSRLKQEVDRIMARLPGQSDKK